MWQRRLLPWLGVEPGEAPLVLRLALPYFFLGLAISFFETAALAIFLTDFTAQNLPTIYILNALVIVVVTLLFYRLSQQASLPSRVAGNLIFLLVMTIVFWLGVRGGPAVALPAIVFLLPVASETIKVLIKSGYWGAAIRVFDLRQGKRLFGLLGSGRWVAFMVAGLLTPLIVGRLGVESLLLLAGLSIAIAIPLMLLTLRRLSATVVAPAQAKAHVDASQPHTVSRYVWLIFGLIFIWFLAAYVTDNIFFDRTSYRFPDEQELASFLGVFSFVRGAVTLMVTLVISRAVTRRFGLRTAVLLLPVLVFGLAVLMLIAAGQTQVDGVLPAAGSVFILAVALKLVDKAFGDTDEQSTLSILYQPLRAADRDWAQVIGTGVVKPVAIGAAGALLLMLDGVFGVSGFSLTYLLVGLALVWIGVAWAAGRQYVAQVSSAVTRRRLGGLAPDLADATGIRSLQQLLDSPQPGKALYALRVLSEVDAFEHLSATVRALGHPEAEVRLAAIAQAAAIGRRLNARDAGDLVAATRHLAGHDPDPTVRGQAMMTLALIDPGSATVQELREIMTQSPAGLKSGALAGMLILNATHPELVSVDEATGFLLATADENVEVALDAIAAAPSYVWAVATPIRETTADLVGQALDAHDPAVRTAALRATGVLRQEALWPAVIRLLDDPHASGPAKAALFAGGQEAVPALAAQWHTDLTLKTRSRLAQTLGQLGGDDALALLAADLDHPQPAVRTQILRALSRANYPVPRATVDAMIMAEAEDATWALAALVDLEGLQDQLQGRLMVLAEPLESYLIASRNRILYLLALVYNRRLILEGQRAFDQARRLHGRPEARERLAYALESLDLHLEPAHKRLILPLLENWEPARARDNLSGLFPDLCRPMAPSDRLTYIMAEAGPRGHSWLRATAIYVAAQLRLSDQRPEIAAALTDRDPIVRETAQWALDRLDGPADGNGPLLIVEKTLLMKRIPIFAEVQNSILAEYAQSTRELILPAGATIFQEGDVADTFYVIASGTVHIHKGEHTLNELGPLAVFGEMGTLTGEPRSASATTATATRVLRLERQVLDELIDENPHIGISVVHVVAGYLRHQVNELLALRSSSNGDGAA